MFSSFRSWLRAFKRPSSEKPAETAEEAAEDGALESDAGPVIDIHEDDWGMRNLYPVEATNEAQADMNAATESGEKNRDPSGFGWTDIHVIEPPKINYSTLGLRLADAAAALAPIMPRVRRFYATVGAAMTSGERDPYGSYDEDAWCFGTGPDCFIKLDPDGDLVHSIWFDFSGHDSDAADRLKRALLAIHGLAPSVIADYWANAFIPVADENLFDLYIRFLKGIKQPS